MIIIEKKKLIGAMLFSFALIVATAIWGYRVGIQNALKSDSELVLFCFSDLSERAWSFAY